MITLLKSLEPLALKNNHKCLEFTATKISASPHPLLSFKAQLKIHLILTASPRYLPICLHAFSNVNYILQTLNEEWLDLSVFVVVVFVCLCVVMCMLVHCTDFMFVSLYLVALVQHRELMISSQGIMLLKRICY